MRELKAYIWVIPYLGLIICLVALFTPTAYFENVFWNHEIINWIWGFYQDTYNSIVTIAFYDEPIKILPSIILSTVIVISILVCGTCLIRDNKDIRKGLIKLVIYVGSALCVIASVILWMVMMEIAERTIWGISMWGRYIPSFGVIGLLLGSVTIIIGSLLIKYIKTTPTKEKS